MSEKDKDIASVFEELTGDEEVVSEQIETEWERRYQKGLEVREGDASRASADRWWSEWGGVLVSTLRRMGVDVREDEEENG